MGSVFNQLQLQRSRVDKVEDKLKEEQEAQHILSNLKLRRRVVMMGLTNTVLMMKQLQIISGS